MIQGAEAPVASERPGRTGSAVLQISDLVVEFPTEHGVVTAVDAVSLTVEPGQRIGVVGESGSGKSTLALAILGLIEPPGRISRGELRCGEIDLRRASEPELRKVRGGTIAMIFQDALGSLNPVMTIGAQLREAILEHRQVSRREADEHAVELLREVGVPAPESRISQYPHEFSGGMRQRVMIAMALACDPAVLIADEPTTALDVTTQASVVDLLARLSDERQMAVIFITHDLGIIAGFAREVLVMYAGAPVEYGTVDDVFAAPGHPYTQALMEAVPQATESRAGRLRTIPGSLPPAGSVLPGCRFEPRCSLGSGRPRCIEQRPAFDIGDPGLRAACHYTDEARARARLAPPEPAARAETVGGELLQVRELRKTYVGQGSLLRKARRLRAVDGISFEIARGESFGLVGESGSGKSTVARLVLGLLPSDAGAIRFEGSQMSMRSTRDRRGRMQMVFQDPGDSLNPRMRVEDIVAEPLLLLGRGRTSSHAGRVAELLELVGLDPYHRRRRPGELSGGQRQRVAIARALATDPALVACDEAVSSLDVSVRAQILNLLRDLQERLGVSYLFISHDLSVVRHVCDRVVVMYAGRFVETAPADELFQTPRHPYTLALLSAVPVPDPVVERQRERIRLEGDPPDLAKPLEGCVFASRCWKVQDVCRHVSPPLEELSAGHGSACHFPENPPGPTMGEES
ncbi:MAG: peptide/nickel transport system ATP-binding protein ddpF [Gaiellales bacterium]|nr:peptide/nickel transport system ATP-binding protein ddpF [Gaiellales bacterium]